MTYVALKDFKHAPDGMRTVNVQAGQAVRDARPEIIAGLVDAGFIAPGKPKAGAATTAAPKNAAPEAAPNANGQVEIPAGWNDKSFGFFNLQKLVKSITGTNPANKVEAVAAMDAEIARRAGVTA